jgi:hypothetical protein
MHLAGRARGGVDQAAAAEFDESVGARRPRSLLVFRGTPGFGIERRHDEQPAIGREAERTGDRPVRLDADGELFLPTLIRGVLTTAGAAMRDDELLQLRARAVLGQVKELRFGPGRRDPGDRAHLGVAQPRRRERGGDGRQLLQCARNPHLLARRPQAHPALPRQPMRRRGHPPLAPTLGRVELTDQRDQPRRRRGQLTRELDNLSLEPLQRTRARTDRCRIRRRRDHALIPSPTTDTFPLYRNGHCGVATRRGRCLCAPGAACPTAAR